MRRPDPSAWRKFRKARRLSRGDLPGGPVLFWGVRVEQLAEWGRVSRKHAALIKSGLRVPSPQLVALVSQYVDGRVLVGPFARFSVRGEKLVTPEGLEFLASELQAYGSLLEWARTLAVQLGREGEYWRRVEGVRESA
jgi:hypothetical protein